MFNYTVQIAVDPPNMFYVQSGVATTGNFVYTPAMLRVSPGDTVTWMCHHAFTLTFKGAAPIDHESVSSSYGDTPGFSGATFYAGPYTISHVKGQFHYAVAVWDGTQIFMDGGCPSLSVN